MSRDVEVAILVDRGRRQGGERYCRAETRKPPAAGTPPLLCGSLPYSLGPTRVLLEPGTIPCREPVCRRRQQHHLGFRTSEFLVVIGFSCCVVSTLTNRVLLPSAPKPQIHLFLTPVRLRSAFRRDIHVFPVVWHIPFIRDGPQYFAARIRVRVYVIQCRILVNYSAIH